MIEETKHNTYMRRKKSDGKTENKLMTEVGIAEVKEIYSGIGIDNDLLLFDEIGDLPIPNRPRHMKCILVGLCLSGTAEYSVDTKRHVVTPHDVIIVSEGQVTDNYRKSDDFSGIAILMSDDFFHEIIKGVHDLSSLFLFSRTHPVCHISDEDVLTLTNYFKLIKLKAEQTEHHFRKDVVRSLLMATIYDLSNTIYKIQNTGEKKYTRAETIFTRFIQMVEQHFRTERRVGWYAKQLCITPKYLSETVKIVSHRTPNEWIDDYVTLEIRVLLKNTTHSIKEIAEMLHFPNQSFLGKYFKEHVGMSPSEYRKS